MKQKTHISVLIFDYRSVFVVVVSNNLEGDQDYGQQALATCTFMRSHVRRGVASMVLMHVKAQGAKSVLLAKVPNDVSMFTRSIIAHTKQITDCVSHCLVKARIVIMNNKPVASTEQ